MIKAIQMTDETLSIFKHPQRHTATKTPPLSQVFMLKLSLICHRTLSTAIFTPANNHSVEHSPEHETIEKRWKAGKNSFQHVKISLLFSIFLLFFSSPTFISNRWLIISMW
jgi:hypothetical protein